MKKICLLLLFLNVLTRAVAQVEDDFYDGNFSSSPAWSGHTSDFNVNSSGQLQLNASAAGSSYLSVPCNLAFSDSVEWRFFINLDFSPSTSNFAKVYLSSEKADLQQPLNGYYLQFGESLSDDAIELFRQDSTVSISILRAANGSIASAFSAGVRVVRTNSGQWILSADYNGGNNYVLQDSGFDNTYNSAAFIGINCTYTGGNIQGFYFDNFYAGKFLRDTIPPEIVSANAVNDSTLSVLFSEQIEQSSLNSLVNYFINSGAGNPVSVSPDSIEHLKYYLNFNYHFQSGIAYELSLSGLKDLSGNQIISSVRNFTFYQFTHAHASDLVISEFYFAPSEESPLPEAEYTEIYNRKDSAVFLSGWTISDGTAAGLIPEVVILPHEYIVFCSEDDTLLFAGVQNVIPVESFPALNNDGDQIILSDENGNIIDELIFDPEFYHEENKNDGGWSIERIDAEFTCKNENNWKASSAVLHGTPGTENSVKGIFRDSSSPYIVSAIISDSTTLQIAFSEPIYSGGADLSNYSVTDKNSGNIFPATILFKSDSAWLYFNQSFSQGIYSLKISNSLSDCSGNSFLENHIVKYGIPEKPEPGNVIINEILFSPYSGGNDFIELYNNSEKVIDLKSWTISETDISDINDVKEIAVISEANLLLLPKQFLVLSESEKNVKRFYNCENEYAFFNVKDPPDFSSDEGRTIIADNNGNVQCDLKYSDEMHFALLSDTRGVSLERLSYFSGDQQNWHSAAGSSGFATPGYENSQIVSESNEGDISVDPQIFSPDNDGYNDVLSISYNFSDPGIVLTMNVYDYNGQLVRTILGGETMGRSGIIPWDGLTDDRLVASSGIYILLASTFDLEGNSSSIKKAIFLKR